MKKKFKKKKTKTIEQYKSIYNKQNNKNIYTSAKKSKISIGNN